MQIMIMINASYIVNIGSPYIGNAMQQAKQVRTYYEVDNDAEACRDGLMFDRYKCAFYTCTPEQYEGKYVKSDITQYDEIPAESRMYLRSEFADIPILKRYKCHYSPVYKLWYVSRQQWETTDISKHFKPMYESGRLRPF
jgi:hypothetical protein